MTGTTTGGVDEPHAAADDHVAHMDVLQKIITRLARAHQGGDPRLIEAELEAEMKQAGLGTGARKWMQDTASEIAAGRVVVTDALHDLRPDKDDHPSGAVRGVGQRPHGDESRG